MRRKASIPVASGAALLLAVILGGHAIAQPPPTPATANTPNGAAAAGNTDQELLSLSAQGNIAEVELGRLAVTRSTSPAVQNLGTRLAQDGSKGVANLQTVAAMLHVELPTTPSAAQEGQIAKLRNLQGAAFDRTFGQIAHQDESRMLHQFQSGVSMARNEAVKSTIKDMIPVVQEHLQIAQGIPTREASASEATAR